MKIVFHKHPLPFQLPDGTIQEVAKEYATCGTEFLKRPAQKSSDFI